MVIAIVAGFVIGLTETTWITCLPAIFPLRGYILTSSNVVSIFFLSTGINIIANISLSIVIYGLFKSISKKDCDISHKTIPYLCTISCLALYLFNSHFNTYTNWHGLSTQLILNGLLITPLLIQTFLRNIKGKVTLYLWMAFSVILSVIIIYNCSTLQTSSNLTATYPKIKSDKQPNILFITIDTLRHDYLACFGNTFIKTPNIDQIAAEGYLFKNAFSHVPYTTPSHCSMMSSTYPVTHGAFNGRAMKLGIPTIAEILQHNNYDTAAVVSLQVLKSTTSGLDRGFDYYDDSLSEYTTLYRHDFFRFIHLLDKLSITQTSKIPGNIVSDRILNWLTRKRNNPFFCWTHICDPHDPYDAPEPYKLMYQNIIKDDKPLLDERIRYAGEVTYTDLQLGRIFDTLRKAGTYDDTIIIITSDHGEAFGEIHDGVAEFKHGQFLHDTTLHVPLIIKLPKGSQPPKQIETIVELIDIVPTIFDYLAIDFPETFEGVSLLPTLNDKVFAGANKAFSEIVMAGFFRPTSKKHTLLRRPEKTIRTNEYRYIYDFQNQSHQYYDLVNDPDATTNIFMSHFSELNDLRNSLNQRLPERFDDEPFSGDKKTIEILRSLGYVD